MVFRFGETKNIWFQEQEPNKTARLKKKLPKPCPGCSWVFCLWASEVGPSKTPSPLLPVEAGDSPRESHGTYIS